MPPTALKDALHSRGLQSEDAGPGGLRVPTAHFSSLRQHLPASFANIEKEAPIFTLLGLLDKKLFL